MTPRPSQRARRAAQAIAIAVLVAGLQPARGAEVTGYTRHFADYARPLTPTFPDDNAYSVARSALGKALFFDPRLSGSGQMSCASCHDPGRAWGDGLPRAIGSGKRVLGRRTPSIVNLAWGDRLFWDGRAASLEEQALGPIQSPAEMDMPLAQVTTRLQGIAGYRDLFDRAYPGEGISPASIGKGIATFERTVVSGIAPFDRWITGDESAITTDAKRGFLVFNNEGLCSTCHSGWRFTDDSFHDIGVRTSDLGRGHLLKTLPSMQSAFKTPTLRDVAKRGPFMHNGSVATLEDVVALYNRGGLVQRPSLSPDMKPLHLTSGQAGDLVAFLRTLTGDESLVKPPVLPQ